MTNNLRSSGKKWLVQLKEIANQGGFVGEIDLSEEETLEISEQLRDVMHVARYFDNEMAAVLAVVTVNLAYYFYEGEGGQSFLQYLGPENYEHKKIIGDRIENLLFDLGIISQRRSGSFRYIGEYVRQSIVTKHYLPRLSKYITRFYGILGIREIEQLTFEEYKNIFINMIQKQFYQTGILIEILKKTEGFNLIKTICYHIDQVRKGQMLSQELIKLPGFRTGFWDAFVHLYEKKGNIFTSFKSRYKYPSFIYNADENKIGISFDEIGVSNRVYQINNNGNKELIENEFVPFEDEEQLQNEISVYIEKREKFLINSWVPDNESPFQALFDYEQGNFISSINHPREILKPGSYYLITKESISNEIKQKLGLNFSTTLELDSEEWYEVWQLNLEPGVNLHKLGKSVEKSNFIGLEWENPKYLPGTHRVSGIFVGKMPRLIIKKWKKLRKRYQLFLEYPDDKKICHIAEKNLTYKGNDAYFSFMSQPQVNKLGKIKLSVLGYSSLIPNNSELKFLLLSKNFKIKWSHYLLERDERPFVSLESSFDLEMEWSKKCTITKENKNFIYTFEPNTIYVEGKSKKINGLNINLFFLFAQAYPLFPQKPCTSNILWSSALKESFDFIIYGHKRYIIELGIISDKGEFSIWKDVDENLYKNRKTKIHSLDLKDGMAGLSVCFGRFSVKYDNSWKEADCTFIDDKAFIEAIIDCNESVQKYLHHDLKDIFQKAISIIKNEVIHFQIDINPNILPDRIINFLTFLELGYRIFDCQDYVDFTQKNYYDAKYYDWLRWYCESIKTNQSIGEKPQTEMPPIERWKKKIEVFISRIKQIEDIPKLLSEWKNDIIDCFSAPQNELSKMEKGKDIRRAGFYYIKNKYSDALNISHNLQKSSLQKPVRVIAETISILAKLNLWKFEKLTLNNNSYDPWDILLEQIKSLNNLFQNDDINAFIRIFSSQENAIQLLKVLEEDAFKDLIINIQKKEWNTIKQLSSKYPVIKYLLYKNKMLCKKVGLESNTLQKKLRQLQYKQIVPYSVQIK